MGMTDRKTIMNWLEGLSEPDWRMYHSDSEVQNIAKETLDLLKAQEARIKKYEYLFDFLGIGFREWATKILDGEAEAICEADEHEHKTVITFKLI